MSSGMNSERYGNGALDSAGIFPVTGKSRITRVCSKITAVAALCILASAGLVQAATDEMQTHYQYAAKVVCSLLTPHRDGDLARGTYRTAINVHNPTDQEIVIANKVALAVQPGSDPGPFSVTPFKKTTLPPNGAVLFDCGNVAGFFCPINGVCVDFAFLDGFVVIKSPVELDVVGVYTARHTEGEVESIDVETVQPKQISAAVKLVSEDKPQRVEKRLDYPRQQRSEYGKQFCGGIATIPCPTGKKCIDDPSDECDPTKGGADCSGICVKDSGK